MSNDERPPSWSEQQPPPFVPPNAGGDTGWGEVQPAAAPQQQPDAQPGWSPPPAAPKPGVIPLRPLSVGDIMTGAIEYVRRDPGAVISISAAVGVLAAFVQLGFLAATSPHVTALLEGDPAKLTPQELMSALGSLGMLALASAAIAGILQVLGTGMLTHVMGRSAIGKHTTAGEAWQLVRPQAFRLIGATVLVALLSGAAFLLPIVPGVVLLTLGATGPGAALLVLGLGVSVVLGVWVSFELVLTTPTLALEDCGPLTAMRRSWHLVRGGFWRTLGIVFVGTLLGQAVGSVAAVPFTLIGGGGGGELDTLAVFSAAIGGMVTILVALPFVAGVTALVYIDRRIRTEGLATKLASAAASGEGGAGPSNGSPF